jgi:hypothetical protein
MFSNIRAAIAPAMKDLDQANQKQGRGDLQFYRFTMRDMLCVALAAALFATFVENFLKDHPENPTRNIQVSNDIVTALEKVPWGQFSAKAFENVGLDIQTVVFIDVLIESKIDIEWWKQEFEDAIKQESRKIARVEYSARDKESPGFNRVEVRVYIPKD